MIYITRRRVVRTVVRLVLSLFARSVIAPACRSSVLVAVINVVIPCECLACLSPGC
jgi:hypothetical protein